MSLILSYFAWIQMVLLSIETVNVKLCESGDEAESRAWLMNILNIFDINVIFFTLYHDIVWLEIRYSLVCVLPSSVTCLSENL